MKRRLPLALLVVAMLLMVALRRCDVDDSGKPGAVMNVAGTPITADDLYSAYVVNAVAADERFKGKVLAVSGTVQGVAKYGKGTAVNLLTRGGRGVIQCYFEENQNQLVARLTRGQWVVIKGRCDEFFEDTVLIYECVMQ